MSNTGPNGGTNDIGERLKSAAEIEPAKLPRLTSIAEQAAEELTLALNRLSLEKVTVTFGTTEISYGPDADDPSEGHDLVAAFTSKRFSRPSYVAASKSIADACIGCFFGAAASDRQRERELTDLDRALIRETFKAVVESFALAFQPIDDAGFGLGAFVAPTEFEDRFGGTRAARHVELEFEIRAATQKSGGGAARGAAPAEEEPLATISLGLPATYLALHRRTLAEPVRGPEPSPDESWSEAMVRNFESSGLHLEAVLARREMPLRDVAHLRVGQTLSLEVGVSELITLECEGKPIFRSQVGFARGSYVARFEETVDPTREFIDDILSD